MIYQAKDYASKLSCSPSSVVRGGTVTCSVTGAPASATFSQWKFTDSNSNTVTGTGTSGSWSGKIVATSGTVSVAATVGGGGSTTLTASLTVSNRNWHTDPASPDEVPNGTFNSLPVPPQPSPPDSGLGYSQWHAAYSSLNYLTVTDGGPNQGYTYWPSNLSFSSFYYQYEINPDLENSGSTFSRNQCGNYDANSNPNGFVSWSNLLAQTQRHEYNSSVQSHYAFYSNSLTSNNPGDFLEEQVAAPGSDLTSFASNTKDGIDSRFSKVQSDSGKEPYAVNYSEAGVPLGNINYAPYTACN